MSIDVTPHLNFRGDARSALELYQSVFGGHAVINTYADFGKVDRGDMAKRRTIIAPPSIFRLLRTPGGRPQCGGDIAPQALPHARVRLNQPHCR